MKQSQNFQEWMQRYNANRQISISPTHGKLYQQKSHNYFGPTLCLYSKNNESTQISQTNKQRQEELMSKIVLLASLTQALSDDKKILEMQKQQWFNFERPKKQSQIRELNQRLKRSQKQYQQKYEQAQSAYKKELQELKHKSSRLQLQNKNLSNLLKQSQERIQKIELKVVNKEKELQSARMESSTMKQSIDIQRSRFRSQNQSNQSLRDRIKRCQEINTDLKFIVNAQKEQINKQRQKQTDITYKYEIQIDTLKNQINDVHIEYSKMKEQQNKQWHSQILQLQTQVDHIKGLLKEKSQIIEKQLIIIKQKDNKCLQFGQKMQQLQNTIHDKVNKIEKSLNILYLQKKQQLTILNQQREYHELKMEELNSALLETIQKFSQKQLEYEGTINQLLSKLNKKENHLKKLKQKLKQAEFQSKNIASKNLNNYNIDNRLRAQSSLDQIYTTFIQLKSSNQRSSKLIQNNLKVINGGHY